MKASLYLIPLLSFSLLHTTTPEQKQFFSSFIKPNDLVFDVGAFIGQKTDLYLACGARVICIEPQSIACAKLHYKYKGNHDVRIANIGCADKPGFLEFAIATTGRTISTFSKEWQTDGRYSPKGKDRIRGKWDEFLKVRVITLDTLIQIYGMPQFCKIDVENFEFEVLSGLSQPIKTVCFEFHIEMFHNLKKCIDRLETIGYKKFNFTVNDAYSFAVPNWASGKALLKQILLYRKQYHAPDLLWGDVYASFS